MVKFVTEDQKDKVERPLDFTRVSEGYKTSGQFVGSALEDIGSTLLRGANDLDKKFGEYVTEQAKDSVERARIGQHGVDSGRFPPEVAKSYENLRRKQSAAASGGTSGEKFNLELLSEMKRLNLNHPGYGDEILKGLGINPANAVVADRQARANAANRAANDKTKKDASFVDWANKNTPGVWQAWMSSGQKGGVDTLRIGVAEHKLQEETRAKLDKDIDIKIKNNEFSKDTATQEFMSRVNQDVDNTLSMVTGEYEAIQKNITNWMNNSDGGTLTPEQEKIINFQLQQLVIKGTEMIDRSLMSNSSYQKYPEEAQKAREFGQKRLQQFAKSIIGKEVNLALVSSAVADKSVDQSKLKNIKDPDAMTALRLKEIYGDKAMNAFLKEKGISATALGKAISTDVAVGIGELNKPLETFTEGIQRIYESGVEDPGAYKDLIRMGQTILTDQDTKIEARYRAAQFFFDPKNIGLITKFDEKDQMIVLSQLMSPQMSKTIREISSTYNKPELIDNFNKVFVASFNDATRSSIDTLNDYQTTKGMGELYINPISMMVSVVNPENGVVTMPQQGALAKLNQGLHLLNQHWSSVGDGTGKPWSTEMRYGATMAMLENAGLKVGAPKEPRIMERVLNGLKSMYEPIEWKPKSSNTTPSGGR